MAYRNPLQLAVAACRGDSYLGRHGMRDPVGMIVSMLDRQAVAAQHVSYDDWTIWREGNRYFLYCEGSMLAELDLPEGWRRLWITGDEKDRNPEVWCLVGAGWIDIGWLRDRDDTPMPVLYVWNGCRIPAVAENVFDVKNIRYNSGDNIVLRVDARSTENGVLHASLMRPDGTIFRDAFENLLADGYVKIVGSVL